MEDKIQICALDFAKEDLDFIENDNYHIYKGTAGTKITIKHEHNYGKECLLNHDFPKNLHEYDILLINLNNNSTIEYKSEDHVRKNVSTSSELKFEVKYPTNLFDPRPYSLVLLGNSIEDFFFKKSIILVFASAENKMEYQMVINDSRDRTYLEKVEYSNFSFLSRIELKGSKNGHKSNILIKDTPLSKVLEEFQNEIEYHQTFETIGTFENRQYIKHPDFNPLIETISGEVISFSLLQNQNITYVFPDIKSKGKFLQRFISEVLPDFFPNLSSADSKNHWLSQDIYYVPKHSRLLEIKNEEIENHKKKLVEIEKEIDVNKQKYAFLHNLIIETGDKLVESVVEFFGWLGFKNVKKMDEHSENGLFEEDIQIEIEDKLLVIEVKGIAGTSKDKECSQISKIKYRRMEERNSFQVFGLYIVNHERFKPPILRTNPPFNDVQIKDALYDKRGLLTTWELFKLYFNIEEGIFTKEEIREEFLKFGLVDFNSKLIEIGKVDKFFPKANVASLELNGNEIKIGDELIGNKNGFLRKYRILSIEIDRTPVNSASLGRVGIKLDKELSTNTVLFKR